MKKISEELIEHNKNQSISEVDTFTLMRYRLFNKHFGKNTNTVLDYGCNTGRGGVLLKSINGKKILYGADIISERLDKIPSNIYEIIVDLNTHNLKDKIPNVDAIISGEVVEHIPINQLLTILQEFYDILTKDGIIMLTTPNPKSILVRMGRDSVFKDPSHVNIMDYEFLITLLKKIGFSDIKIFGSGKATKYFGENFPLLGVYGSYMLTAKK